MRPYLLILGAVFVLAGCGPRLVPAGTADRVAGMRNAAMDEANGIRMTVQAGWEGDPANLESAVTPVRIILNNQSGHSVRVRYRDFTLATGAGFRSAAIPPFRIKGSVPETRTAYVRPYYGWSGFYLAPHYSPYYGPVLRPWGGPWFYDEPYYTTYTLQKPLPTEDMLEKALPEGVLESGGDVTGNVYFQRIPEDVRSVEFQAKLMDPVTEQTVAALAIPFVVRD